MEDTIEQYHGHAKEIKAKNPEEEQYVQKLKHEAANMAKKIEILEDAQRNLLGQGSGSCSMEELCETDNLLERSLISIRAKKEVLFKEKVEQFGTKERLLLEENARLWEKCGSKKPMDEPAAATKQKEVATCSSSSSSSPEVETELFIGMPRMRCCS